MPTNLYGPGDNFDLTTSHVIPALVRKFSEAVENGDHIVPIWGTGQVRREFMHVDDCADAIAFLMENVESNELANIGLSHVNIGTGTDLTINELAKMIAAATGFIGGTEYDADKPDGTPQKLLDVSILRSFGWRFSIALEDGLKETIKWFLENTSISRKNVAAETL